MCNHLQRIICSIQFFLVNRYWCGTRKQLSRIWNKKINWKEWDVSLIHPWKSKHWLSANYAVFLSKFYQTACGTIGPYLCSLSIMNLTSSNLNFKLKWQDKYLKLKEGYFGGRILINKYISLSICGEEGIWSCLGVRFNGEFLTIMAALFGSSYSCSISSLPSIFVPFQGLYINSVLLNCAFSY